MTRGGGIFVAPSGNTAHVTIATLDRRTLVDIGWEHHPPSEADQQACQSAIHEVLRAEGTVDDKTRVVNEVFSDDEAGRREWEHKRRDFFAGGKE